MVYNAAQTTTFIENPAQMGVYDRICQYLADNEGLMFVHEFIDYVQTDTWKQITDNMRRPPMIPDPANVAQMIHQAEFVLSAKSLGLLIIAAVAVSLFSMKYCPLSIDIMIYDSCLKFFKVHMDATKDKRNNDTNEPPKWSRNLPMEY